MSDNNRYARMRIATQRLLLRQILGDGVCLVDTRQIETAELYDPQYHDIDIVDVIPASTLAEIESNMHGAPIVHFYQKKSGLCVTAVRWKGSKRP